MTVKTHISGRDVLAVGACESGILDWCKSVGICMDAEIETEAAIELAYDDSVMEWLKKAAQMDGDGYGDGNGYGDGYGDGDGDGYGGNGYGDGYGDGDGDGDGDGYGGDDDGDGDGGGDGDGYGGDDDRPLENRNALLQG